MSETFQYRIRASIRRLQRWIKECLEEGRCLCPSGEVNHFQ